MNGAGQDNSGEIKVIIRTLALSALLCVAAECALSYLQLKIPPELNTLTGGLVGALTAMLVKTAPTASVSTEPIQTQITNPPTQPVPVASVEVPVDTLKQ